MRTRRVSLFAVGCASLIVAAACGRKASGGENTGGTNTISVSNIDLGRTINADLTLKDKASTFKPSDVVYAVVETQGAAPATLGVRWIYDDKQVIDEGTREIHPTGATRTEFHISKPDGLPEGHYRIEVTLSGASAGTKEFDVKK